MIRLLPGARVFVCTRPVRLNKGFAGLAGIVHNELGGDLLTGDLFVFMSRSRKLVKALFWDGTGLVLVSKRIARGRFATVWQPDLEGAVRVTRRDLEELLSGADVTRKIAWRK